MTALKVARIILISLAALFTHDCNGQNIVEGYTMADSKQYKIEIMFGDTILTATLNDNPTARDFISLLPLDLELEDYHGIEKISYLPRKLSAKDAPAGLDPSVGDITYYAPWGNLAIFYEDFGYAQKLIHLGKIDSGMEELSAAGSMKVRIELSK